MNVRILLCAVLFIGMLASCAPALARTRLAPADEYFGRYKMSVLEIDNRLRDTTYRASHGSRPEPLVGDAERTEDAMRDWERKYPSDPWLPHDWARLVHLYASLHCSAGRDRMDEAYRWSRSRYRWDRSIASEGREVAAVDAHARRAVAYHAHRSPARRPSRTTHARTRSSGVRHAHASRGRHATHPKPRSKRRHPWWWPATK